MSDVDVEGVFAQLRSSELSFDQVKRFFTLGSHTARIAVYKGSGTACHRRPCIAVHEALQARFRPRILQGASLPPWVRSPLPLCSHRRGQASGVPSGPAIGLTPEQGSALRAWGPLQLPQVHPGRGNVGPSLQRGATCATLQSGSAGPLKSCCAPLLPACNCSCGAAWQHVPVTWRLRCPGPHLPGGLSVRLHCICF